MADVVVDITATGTTLRENDLRIVEDVLPSSARFVGNPVAVGTDPRVSQLADTLSELSRALPDASSSASTTESES
jgi:ATP phosphoribosyltransferase regulatory subunit